MSRQPRKWGRWVVTISIISMIVFISGAATQYVRIKKATRQEIVQQEQLVQQNAVEATPTLIPTPTLPIAPATPATATPTSQLTNDNNEEWKENKTYQQGDLAIYEDKNYECIQGHTSLKGWEPAIVPALWKETSKK